MMTPCHGPWRLWRGRRSSRAWGRWWATTSWSATSPTCPTSPPVLPPPPNPCLIFAFSGGAGSSSYSVFPFTSVCSCLDISRMSEAIGPRSCFMSHCKISHLKIATSKHRYRLWPCLWQRQLYNPGYNRIMPGPLQQSTVLLGFYRDVVECLQSRFCEL